MVWLSEMIMFDVFGQREQAFLKVRILMDFEYLLFSFESMGSQQDGVRLVFVWPCQLKGDKFVSAAANMFRSMF